MDRWVRHPFCASDDLIQNFSRIKDHAAAVVSDEAFARRGERWFEGAPDTKEGYFLRATFDGEGLTYTYQS